MENPAKSGVPRYEMTVESTSHNPYHSGFLELDIRESKLRIRWEGEKKWDEIEWHEIAHCCGIQKQVLIDDITIIKEKAYTEAYALGFKNGCAENLRIVEEKRAQIKLVPVLVASK